MVFRPPSAKICIVLRIYTILEESNSPLLCLIRFPVGGVGVLISRPDTEPSTRWREKELQDEFCSPSFLSSSSSSFLFGHHFQLHRKTHESRFYKNWIRGFMFRGKKRVPRHHMNITKPQLFSQKKTAKRENWPKKFRLSHELTLFGRAGPGRVSLVRQVKHLKPTEAFSWYYFVRGVGSLFHVHHHQMKFPSRQGFHWYTSPDGQLLSSCPCEMNAERSSRLHRYHQQKQEPFCLGCSRHIVRWQIYVTKKKLLCSLWFNIQPHYICTQLGACFLIQFQGRVMWCTLPLVLVTTCTCICFIVFFLVCVNFF